MRHADRVTLLAPFLLAGPLLLLAIAVVALWSYGPLGWLAAVLLVVGVLAATWWSTKAVLRWWRGTKVAEPRRQLTPAERRRLPPEQRY